MLKVGDYKPEVLRHVLDKVIALAEKGLIKPAAGKEYYVSQLAEAHTALENRTTMGKVIVKW